MKTIEMIEARARKPEWSMAEPVNFTLDAGEHIAIVGRNGAGKSMFVDMLTGRHPAFPGMVRYCFDEPYNNLKHITFRDTYGGDNDRTYFLQQRWNQMEIDEETPTVGEKLEEAFLMANSEDSENSENADSGRRSDRRALQHHIYDILGLWPLLDKYIILLSSGELRKYKLAANLFSNPKVLIIENPFIGLDAETRDQVKALLKALAEEQGVQMILVLAKSDEVPEFVTHIVEVREMKVLPKVAKVLPKVAHRGQTPCNTLRCSQMGQSPCATDATEAQGDEAHGDCPSCEEGAPATGLQGDCPLRAEVIRFNKVTIRYGERTILKDLDWVVMRGEHWALSGQNGSGKSTLLSLVCADNPQRYACDISLFGHKRGSGESIWDIKKRIGYISPEMHRSYKQNIPALQIVASGLKDTIGLYSTPTPAEKDQCIRWMNIFGIGHLADRRFLEMSSGEQRLVLLARAFVKSPELLILDEPLHGLDLCNRDLVKGIVDRYMSENPDRTLIYVTHYENELPNCIEHSIFLKRS